MIQPHDTNRADGQYLAEIRPNDSSVHRYETTKRELHPYTTKRNLEYLVAHDTEGHFTNSGTADTSADATGVSMIAFIPLLSNYIPCVQARRKLPTAQCTANIIPKDIPTCRVVGGQG
jgi:hypothetical protein